MKKIKKHINKKEIQDWASTSPDGPGYSELYNSEFKKIKQEASAELGCPVRLESSMDLCDQDWSVYEELVFTPLFD